MKDFKFLKEDELEVPKYKFFDVTGAGDIKIGELPNALCGESGGFHFSVSWSSSKYIGGVMGRGEARKLANHILSALKECKESEAEFVEKRYKEMDKDAQRTER